MSRRKQAKPRLWKREEEDEDCLENLALNVIYESNSTEDLAKDEVNELDDDESFSVISLHRSTEESEHNGDDANEFKENKFVDEENLRQYSREYLSENCELKDGEQVEHLLLDDDDDDDSLDSDTNTLGTEGGSSWVSEEPTTSASSSCTTPNSTAGTPEPEPTFTIGVTDVTPFPCHYCKKSFKRYSYCKKHEQTQHKGKMLPFRCRFCDRHFKHKRSCDRHMKLHTNEKKYACSLCESAFSRSDHLKIHMKTHDKRKPFQCQVCNRGYNTAAALTSHLQIHKRRQDNYARRLPPGPTFKCLQCSEIFGQPEDLQNHMSVHRSADGAVAGNGRSKSYFTSTTRLICSFCTRDDFQTKEALKTHVESVHKSILNEIQHGSDTSPKKNSSSPTSVAGPSTSPTNPYRSSPNNSSFYYYCDHCCMRFSNVQQLRKHTNKIHAGNKTGVNCVTNNDFNPINYPGLQEATSNGKFYCAFCRVAFDTAIALAQHYYICHSYHSPVLALAPPEQIPEQVKPTDLSVTGKSSSLKCSDDQQTSQQTQPTVDDFSLNHRRDDHASQSICPQCMAEFSDFESFCAHIKSHIDESSGLRGGASLLQRKRPEFTCPHCRRVFSSSEEISEHVLAHFLVNGMAYNCDNCHKVFDKADELHKHLMDVHARHLFSCSICNEIFDSKVSIQVHFAARHSNETKLYRCKSCPGPHCQFHSELEFATHVKTVHMNNAPLTSAFGIHRNSSVVKCPICHVTCSSELDFQVHLATHGKQFQCPLCHQSFYVEYLLDKHMQSHLNPMMNGNLEHQESAHDLSPRHSPAFRLDSPSKKMENGDANGSIGEHKDFVSEMEFVAHKMLIYRKLSSPGKVSTESGESGEEPAKRNKRPLSPSPILRYESPKKLSSTTFNGDHVNSSNNNNNNNNNNNATDSEVSLNEKRDFGNEAESQHKKLIHQTQNMKISSGKMNLLCAYCNENCKSRSELENHMKSHSQNSLTSGKHKCIICDEVYPTATVLAEHKLTHCKVVAGRTCMQCKSAITNEEQFFSHMREHNLINGSVTKNNNNNNNTSSMNHNANKGSSSQLVLPTVCVICRQTLTSDMEARMHARFHLQPTTDLVPCYSCSQMFERQDLMADLCHECYRRRSRNSSPIPCTECHLTFETRVALGNHLACAHKKNFRCFMCPMSFANEKEIQCHIASHMLMDGLNGYRCVKCPMVLRTLIDLQAHQITHSYPECAYNCYFCSSVFPTAHELQAHILSHGPLPVPSSYECSRCKQKFVFATEVEQHKCAPLDEANRGENATNHPIRPTTLYNYMDKVGRPPSSEESMYKVKSSSATFEPIVRFHDESDRYVNDGERKPRVSSFAPALSEKSDEEDQPSVQSLKVKVECKTQDDGQESDDEQIDVVTTKTEDATVEQD